MLKIPRMHCSSKQLLIELSANEHASDFLCPSTNSIKSRVAQETTCWIIYENTSNVVIQGVN